jgi:hypothetical protein
MFRRANHDLICILLIALHNMRYIIIIIIIIIIYSSFAPHGA